MIAAPTSVLVKSLVTGNLRNKLQKENVWGNSHKRENDIVKAECFQGKQEQWNIHDDHQKTDADADAEICKNRLKKLCDSGNTDWIGMSVRQENVDADGWHESVENRKETFANEFELCFIL